MNLLEEAWIPVLRKNGAPEWIAPWQIGEPDIVALNARRPDFNGALVQFLIGLVQTATPMNSHAEWQEWYDTPPSGEVLKRWFTPIESVFVFDGDGARFMQDFSLRTDGVELKDIGALLIEAPGVETLKDNKDHFIKRGFVTGLCPHCAATALFTLQTNAPEGGRGNLTSLRGGGPLTTLVVPAPAASLWHIIWMNVRERAPFLNESGDASKEAIHFTFPWMTNMDLISKSGGKTAAIQMHPSHVFWGMPRRIRLDMDGVVHGICNICDRASTALVTRYLSKPNGFNYKGGWSHALSPYYEAKDKETKLMEWRPVLTPEGGMGYRHWLGLVMGRNDEKSKRRRASIVAQVFDSRRPINNSGLWCFGFDMESMKARCWYESIFPLYGLAEKNTEGRKLVQTEVAKWIDAADHVAFLLRAAVRSAWFSEGADAKGDWGFVDATFWSRTEPVFYKMLCELVEQARDEEDDPVLTPLRENWRKVLIDVAVKLFDAELVGAAPIERQNPRRVATAYHNLNRGLHGSWKKKKRVDRLREILRLPIAQPDEAEKEIHQDASLNYKETIA